MNIQRDTDLTDTDDHMTDRRARRQHEGGARVSKWVIGLALAVGAAASIGAAPSTADEPAGWDRLDPYYEQYRAVLGNSPDIVAPNAPPLRADEGLDPHYSGYRARLADGASGS